MKKLLFINILILSVINLKSQGVVNDVVKTDYRSNFGIGIKAGLNQSNVYNTKGEDFVADHKYGGVGGIFIAIPIVRLIGLQPEVLISQKGFQATGKLLSQPYSFTRTTTWVDIPLQLSLKPSRFETLLGGPQYSYLMKQKDNFTEGTSSTFKEEQISDYDLRKNVLGAVFGVDVTIMHFVISGRYGFDLQRNNGDGTSSTPQYKNVWLQGTVGFRF